MALARLRVVVLCRLWFTATESALGSLLSRVCIQSHSLVTPAASAAPRAALCSSLQSYTTASKLPAQIVVQESQCLLWHQAVLKSTISLLLVAVRAATSYSQPLTSSAVNRQHTSCRRHRTLVGINRTRLLQLLLSQLCLLSLQPQT